MRLFLLDYLRGIAFILMVIYHIFLFLKLFTNISININNIFLKLFGIFARYLFIILFGFSLYLSYYKYKDNYKEYKKKYIQKIKLLFISSIYITLFTYIILPEKYVYFGVLHFMCLSMILLYYIINKYNILIFLLIILTILSIYMNNYKIYYITNNIVIGILGLGYYKSSMDHFKLLKWLNVVIIGILLGHRIINNKYISLKNNISEKKNTNDTNKLLVNLKWIGSNTLFLYNIHFPIIYIIIYYCFSRP